jgi:hypothetical protein
MTWILGIVENGHPGIEIKMYPINQAGPWEW